MTLADIERLAQAYAATHEEARAQVETLDTELRQLKRRRYPMLFSRAQKAAEAKAALKAAVEESSDLFIKPKTRIVAGVRVGFQKARGEITIDDEEKTLKLIRKHFTEEQADLLIKTTEKPQRKAIAQLSAADAKKIGVEITETGDELVVKVMAGEVEKIVDAFFAELDESGLAAVQED